MTAPQPLIADREALAEVADRHVWEGGYFCSCGHELNSPRGFNDHLLGALFDSGAVQTRAEVVAGLRATVEALAVQWTSATCQTDGAPCSWHRVAAECATEIRTALGGDQ